MNRKKLFKWHSRLALLAMLPLVILSITGSILVFKPEIDLWSMDNHVSLMQGRGERRALDANLQDISQQLPEYELARWKMFDDTSMPDQLFVIKRGTLDWYKVYFNPYQGQVISRAVPLTHDFTDWQMDTNAMAYYISNTLGFLDDTVTITPGLRLEDVNMTFHNLGAGYSQNSRVTEWLPGLTLGYQVASDWFLYANTQRSLRTPQISQLWPKDQTLDSELSWNYETGVRFTPTMRSSISLAVYRIDFDNKIQYNSELSAFENIGSTRSQGVEVQGTFSPMSLPDLTISGAYNYLDTEQLSGEYIGNELTYASKHQVSASVLYNLNEVNLGLMAYYYGPSYADLANTVAENDSGTTGRMPGYTVVNMNISKEIFNDFNLGFSVNNLFDNEYYFRGLDVSPAGRIPAPGRSFTVNLGYNF